MKIAQVAPPWLSVPPKGYGGIEWVVSVLADGLSERGHEVTLFATGDSRTKARLEWVFDRAPGPKWINDLWHDIVHTLHAFAEPRDFDLIHLHTAWSALAVAMHLDTPTVHTLHSSFTQEMRRLYSMVGDRIWFVAISQSQRRLMPELNYVGVVYNGIDVAAYPLRREKDDFLLFLGRTAPEKGPLRAVRAARAAGERLVMGVKIAHHTEQEHWNRDVVPELSPDVTVLGEVSVKDKIDLLTRAKAVLFPIDWDEPFGLVMTEAMACGTPVIATPRGSVPEVLVDGQTGFVVSVEDYPEAAAAALRGLSEIDPAACRARVRERFSKEAMVSGYEAAYRAVLGLGSFDSRDVSSGTSSR